MHAILSPVDHYTSVARGTRLPDFAWRFVLRDSRLNASVRSLVPDTDGIGYWLVASDEGAFAFLASYRGSIPGVFAAGASLNAPVISMVLYGDFYLMVASDGGIFNFSNPPFHGSLLSRNITPAGPVTAFAAPL